jgi:hypothetical protein
MSAKQLSLPAAGQLSLACFVYLGRAGYSTGVTTDARRLQPTVNN